MQTAAEDSLLEYLQSSWIIKIFKSFEIDKSCFEGNPNFSTVAQSIANVGGASHYEHSSQDDDEDIDEQDSPLQFSYSTSFGTVSANAPFLTISGNTGFVLITPKRYWSFLDGNYSSGETNRIKVEYLQVEEKVLLPNDEDEIVGEGWEHTTKSGERDLRYNGNREVYFVQRYVIVLRLQNKSKWKLGDFRKPESITLYTEFHSLLGVEYDLDQIEFNESKEDTSEEKEEAWYDILGISPNVSEEEIKVAYEEKIKQYHPDRVSGLGDKLKIVAEREAQKINWAKKEGLKKHRPERKAG